MCFTEAEDDTRRTLQKSDLGRGKERIDRARYNKEMLVWNANYARLYPRHIFVYFVQDKFIFFKCKEIKSNLNWFISCV